MTYLYMYCIVGILWCFNFAVFVFKKFFINYCVMKMIFGEAIA